MMKFFVVLLLIVILSINIYQIECKFEWKSKPNTEYRVNENETIKLDCEFQQQQQQETTDEQQKQQYYVIWSKNGTTLALNNQLANLNANNLEITGTYNLIIKNLQSKDSGVYTCQLFQSNDLFVNINLTVLVPPKYLKINIEEQNRINELIEGERIKLNCCTNADVNPQVEFKWYKQSLISKSTTELINNNNVRLFNENFINKNDGLLCNGVEINVNRYDNNYEYKCGVSNEALVTGLTESIKLTVEYKPEVSLHVKNMPELINKIDLIENYDTINSIELICNVTAMPDNDLVYEWYLNDMVLSGMTEQYLSLKNLNQSANYSCKCTNKHGYDQSYLYINILYAKLIALNKTTETIEMLQNDETEAKKDILIKSSANSNITLDCELKTNYYSNDIRINWYYYKYINEKPLKLDVNGIVQMQTTINTSENLKLISSKLILNDLNEHQFGYYMCNIENYQVKNSYEQIYDINLNSTYYLQVQFAPNIKVNKNALFTNNNDQLELVCEIESNPESIFVWQFNNREIASNYKYNITTKIIYKNNDFNELNKISQIQSKLVINSINNFDYGSYICKATNLIGETIKTINVERKRVPDVPKNISISKLSSTSLILNWASGANGGEQQQFLLTINNTINLTISVNSLQNEYANESVEIKNLKSSEVYEMKLLALNRIGSSDYSEEFLVQTTDKKLITDNSIEISNAKYKLSDNKIKKFSDEICFDAKLNSNTDNTHLNVRINILSNNMTNELLINDIKIVNGLNCIEYTKYLNRESKNERLVIAYLPSAMKRLSDSNSELKFTSDLQIPAATISLCLMNDTTMCTQEITITNTLIDISNYFTLIALGCSILFIFLLLVIVSICCCCLRKQKNKNKSNSNNGSKLTVTAIPSMSISYPQTHIIECNVNDDGSKSTQRIISNNNFYHMSSGGSDSIHVSDDASSKFSKFHSHSQPTSSTNTVLTVESDVISSASSSAISSGGDSSLQSKMNMNNIQSGYYGNNNTLSKQGLLYPAPQQQQQQQMKSQHTTMSQESAESGYSTPTNFNKKLFYEVIV